MVAGTGLSFRTITAWVALENGPRDNPLNDTVGAHYGSPARAAAHSIAKLRNPKYQRAYGYGLILSTAGQSDKNQLKAIAISDWNGGPFAPESVHIEYAARLEATYNRLFPSGKVHFGPGDITIKNPATQVGPAIGLATGGATELLGKFASTTTWIRVLLVIIGAVALIGAAGIFVRELK
jgi:hypothetical protein